MKKCFCLRAAQTLAISGSGRVLHQQRLAITRRGGKKAQLNCSSCCRLFVSRLIKLNANAQMRQLDHQRILNVAMKYTTMVINLKACEYLNDFKVIPPTLTFCFDATAPVFLSQKKRPKNMRGYADSNF